ncbi:DNA-binding protein [Acrocarpospora corrugata]|uniref:DNA-binding protein n=1 Tax=Acrocarpospora corrugata TaxID=35763 RepID=A0A5M3VMS5_9ACTN|nr:septation protein SepH [Acrocarpospora corrugata]GER97945.1 DNA-binding protein [Acrocarpospora corrugata]
MRPKEIQARIRAGETSEEIAAKSGLLVERVRWFESPILQEREYMAQQAQQGLIKMPGLVEHSPALAALVSQQMKGNIDGIHWDSVKRIDGLWLVSAALQWNDRWLQTEWLYDPQSRHVTPHGHNALHLCSVQFGLPMPARAEADFFVQESTSKHAMEASQPKLSRESSSSAALESDTTSETELGVPYSGPISPVSPSPRISEQRPHSLPFTAEQLHAPPFSPELPVRADEEQEQTSDNATESTICANDPVPVPPDRRDKQLRKRARRTSVPSWDEIMFGAGPKE